MTMERIKHALTRLGAGTGAHRAGSRPAPTAGARDEHVHEYTRVQFLGLPLGFEDRLYGRES